MAVGGSTRFLVAAVSGLTAIGLVPATAAPAREVAATPLTIPALQRWVPGHGTWQLTAATRIVAGPGAATEAQVLADDLRPVVGRRLPVVVGSPSVAGDLALQRTAPARELGREGYRLRVGTVLTIAAPTDAGLFYGGRSVIQLLHQSPSIPRGEAADWPRYPDRGLMVDASRTTYPTGWVLREIRRLAAMKLNVLHLHLTDDQRWGITSRSYPEITSKGAFTRADLRRILALARRDHVTVIPEIEMPGHLASFLAFHPGLELKPLGVVGSKASQQYLTDKLDITNPRALRAMRRILDEYLPLFPGPYWDMGTDEFLSPAEYAAFPQLATYAIAKYGVGATPADAIHGFINWVDRIVRAHGKTLRLWSDQFGGTGHVPVNRDVVAEWWTAVSPLGDPVAVSPTALLADGYQVLNAGWYPNYYTADLGPVAGKANLSSVYTDWQVNDFDGMELTTGTVTSKQTVPADSPGLRGAILNIWGPLPETTAQTAAGIEPHLAVLAQKAWDSPLPASSYTGFERDMGVVGLPVGATPRAALRAAPAAGAHSLVGLVDTRSGSLGPGFVTVAAGVPFGMVTPGPATTTPVGDDPLNYVGYSYQDPEIRGFALTHFSGAGVHIGGELPVMPTTGAVTSSKPSSWASPFAHVTETAQPGYYATTLLPSGIHAELTSTLRTAVERFTFPAGSQANLLFDVTRDNDSNQDGGTQSGAFRITGRRTVAGSVVVPDSGGITIWFAARFDHPFAGSGTWSSKGLKAGDRSVRGDGAGGWVSFGTASSRSVVADIALSYTSAREAERNLHADAVARRGFDATRAAAQRAWQSQLSSIAVTGGSHRQLRTFETAMYHASLMPTTFDDADGRYRGFDGDVHRVSSGHHHYTDLSLWDTYRTQTPLLTLASPGVAHDLGTSLIADTAQNGGVIPRWVRGNRDYGIMGGDSGTPTLATLVTSGALSGAAARTAYDDVVRQATTLPPVDPRSGLDSYLKLGYIPLNISDRGAAVTLEYAIDDASIAALARRFHDAKRARLFGRRAQSWRHLLDPKDDFLRPRMSDGSWATPTSIWLTHLWNPIFAQGWQEGTGWQYLWLVPQDVAGLAKALGRTTMLQRLDRFFTAALDRHAVPVVPEVQAQASVFGAFYIGNQYTPANETDLQAPWLYDWLGEPWRTAQVVHAEAQVFSPGPYGLPGNDDAGTMSAAYVLSAIGLYQAQPGVDAWELSSPMFDSVAIGHRVRITANGSSALRPYVASARLNGEVLRKVWLSYRELRGRLDYTMSASHGSWGSGADAAPPSLSRTAAGG